MSGRLQRERLVKTISREVPFVRGSEVEAGRGYPLIPAAVRTRARGGVLVLLTHAYSVPSVEAALGQRAHVLLREVSLGVAATRQQLLALCGGRGEAVRVGRGV